MSDFATVQLRRVTTGLNDGTHGTFERVVSGVPLLSAKNIVGGRVSLGNDESQISHNDFVLIHQTGYLRRGDVLLTIVGSIGRTAIFDLDEPVAFQRSVASIRPGRNTERRYLRYVLDSTYFQEQLASATRQSAQGGIYLGDLAETRIPIFGLQWQRAIADFLDAETARIDALIESKRRTVELLDERRMAVMSAAVGGVLTCDILAPSTLEWVPTRGHRWREVKLRLVAKLGSGHTPSREHPEWWTDCTVPWITTGEVSQMRSDRLEFLTETREKVSEVGIANSSAEVHPVGTVVLCRTASAGYSAIMGVAMATSQDFATWTCGPKLRPRFLLLCLRAMRQDLLGRLAMGSTHQTIYMPEIEAIRVPLPTLAEQDAVVDAAWTRLRQVDVAGARLTTQLQLLQEHRQALITAAVTGQLDIPGVAA